MLTHNADYLEFLVSKVWRIDRYPLKLAEFGCGYGRFAAMLLPLLANGSSYSGFDSAAALVAKGKEIERELKRDFLHQGKNYHTVSPCVLTFSFGTVEK